MKDGTENTAYTPLQVMSVSRKAGGSLIQLFLQTPTASTIVDVLMNSDTGIQEVRFIEGMPENGMGFSYDGIIEALQRFNQKERGQQ